MLTARSSNLVDESFIHGPSKAADINPHLGGIPVGVVVTDIFTPRPHRIFMGPSKCSWAINFVIFQLEFSILCEVTKLGVILRNFVDVGKILRPLRSAAFK